MPTFIPRHLRYVHAGNMFETDTLSTPTILQPPSMAFQDHLIPTRVIACVARIDNDLKSHWKK